MTEKRKIGSLVDVTPVGLGCMGFSHAYGAPTERKEAVGMIRKAYEMGYDFFDTAECYTGINVDGSTSYNEELVGEALKDVRNKVVIATKFGVRHSPEGLLMDSKPETIRKSAEGSLKRLGVDTIDLYYQHRIDKQLDENKKEHTDRLMLHKQKWMWIDIILKLIGLILSVTVFPPATSIAILVTLLLLVIPNQLKTDRLSLRKLVFLK